jgi:GTP-eEF1A C-terminal domain-like
LHIPKNRVLVRLASAKVEVTLRGNTLNGPSAQVSPIPLETFKTNKEMGRVLMRRGGETIAAGADRFCYIYCRPGLSCDNAGIVVELL